MSPIRPRLAIAFSLAFSLWAQSAFAFDHSKFDGLLKKYVSGGKVDYDGFTTDRATLDEYLKAVASASGTLTEGDYINFYNATVIVSLLDNKLPAKVTDVKGFFDSAKHKIAGKEQTLNDLETYIRKTYKDPRIHFALNCGARSCPPLPGKAFPSDDASLGPVLDKLATTFLNGSGVKIDETKKEIQITKLMDWYGDDFKGKEGSVEAYLQKWVTDEKKAPAIKSGTAGGYKITFLFYNWEINKK